MKIRNFAAAAAVAAAGVLCTPAMADASVCSASGGLPHLTTGTSFTGPGVTATAKLDCRGVPSVLTGRMYIDGREINVKSGSTRVTTLNKCSAAQETHNFRFTWTGSAALPDGTVEVWSGVSNAWLPC